MANVDELRRLAEARTVAGLTARLAAALAVCRMVDDYGRLTAPEFRERYGVATLGAGFDAIKAAARAVLTARGEVPDGR